MHRVNMRSQVSSFNLKFIELFQILFFLCTFTWLFLRIVEKKFFFNQKYNPESSVPVCFISHNQNQNYFFFRKEADVGVGSVSRSDLIIRPNCFHETQLQPMGSKKKKRAAFLCTKTQRKSSFHIKCNTYKTCGVTDSEIECPPH